MAAGASTTHRMGCGSSPEGEARGAPGRASPGERRDRDRRATVSVTSDPPALEALLLELGVALTMTGDAISEIQTQLRAIASGHGFEHARISVFPTLLIVLLDEGRPADVRTIDSIRQLPRDQASEVIRIARRAEAGAIEPGEAIAALERTLASPPRFGALTVIAAHGVLTIGLGLVIQPAATDL